MWVGTNTELLQELQVTLHHEANNGKGEKEAYFGKLQHFVVVHSYLLGPGLSLRELIYDLRWQALILFKCLLLQKRVSSRNFALSWSADHTGRHCSLVRDVSDYV